MESSAYRNALTLIVPYAASVSTLYLFGYWGQFDINIFEYINLSDVVKIAAYQLSIYVLPLFFVGAVSWLTAPIVVRIFSAGGPRTPTVGDKIEYFLFKLFLLGVATAAVYIVFSDTAPSRWLLGGVMMGLVVNTMATKIHFLESALPDIRLRVPVSTALIMIVFGAYGYGALDAHRTKLHGVLVEIDNKATNKIYVGRAGSYAFFWEPESDAVEILSERSFDSMKYIYQTPPPFFDDLSILFGSDERLAEPISPDSSLPASTPD